MKAKVPFWHEVEEVERLLWRTVRNFLLSKTVEVFETTLFARSRANRKSRFHNDSYAKLSFSRKVRMSWFRKVGMSHSLALNEAGEPGWD